LPNYLPSVVDDGLRSGRRTDDNPFSFKRFLQPTGSRRAPGSAGITTLDLANDLPDFVQDYYHTDREHARPHGSRSQATTDAPLPDFALDTDVGRFHTGDLHSHGAAAAGVWMPGDADIIMSNDLTSQHNETLDHRLHNPSATNSSARISQLSDFSVDSDTETSERLDRFSLLDDSGPHDGQCVSTPTDGPLLVAANASGGLPDFLSCSALGVVDICTRHAGASTDPASSSVLSTRPLTNGFVDSESESSLSRVKFLIL